MAKHLAKKHGTELGFGYETIRKILDGTAAIDTRDFPINVLQIGAGSGRSGRARL